MFEIKEVWRSPFLCSSRPVVANFFINLQIWKKMILTGNLLCLCLCISVLLSISLSVSMSLYLSLCLYVSMSLCLYVFLSFTVSFCLYRSLSCIHLVKFVCKTPNFIFIFYFWKNRRSFETILVANIMPAGTGLGSAVLDFWIEHILEIYFGRLILNSFLCLLWIKFLNFCKLFLIYY